MLDEETIEILTEKITLLSGSNKLKVNYINLSSFKKITLVEDVIDWSNDNTITFLDNNTFIPKCRNGVVEILTIGHSKDNCGNSYNLNDPHCDDFICPYKPGEYSWLNIWDNNDSSIYKLFIITVSIDGIVGDNINITPTPKPPITGVYDITLGFKTAGSSPIINTGVYIYNEDEDDWKASKTDTKGIAKFSQCLSGYYDLYIEKGDLSLNNFTITNADYINLNIIVS